MTKEPFKMMDKINLTKKEIVFFDELLRIINDLIKKSSSKTPIDCLECFIKTYSEPVENQKIVERLANTSQSTIVFSSENSWDANILQGIPISENDSLFPTITDNMQPSRIEYRKINKERLKLFVDDLRVLVLTCKHKSVGEWRNRLKFYNIFLHLLSLSFDDNKTLYLKLKEFLDENFALDPEDIIGNLCRINYQPLTDKNPKYLEALEEFNHINADESKLKIWQKAYNVPNTILKVLQGKYKNFDNRLEEYCYHLFHNIESDYTDDFVQILKGQYQNLSNSRIFTYYDDNVLKLICYFIDPKNVSIRDFERCFENIFHLIFDLDYHTGMEYLAFSPKCAFYFDSLIEIIPLNSLTVETLLRYAEYNQISNVKLLESYGQILHSKKDFEQLARFVISNSVKKFDYSKEFIDFFIDNFDKYRAFISLQHQENPVINFIYAMSISKHLECLEDDILKVLLNFDFFSWYFRDTVEIFIKQPNLNERIAFELIQKLFQIEAKLGISTKEYRHILALKIIK